VPTLIPRCGARLGPERLALATEDLAGAVDAAVADLGRMVAIDTSFPPGRGCARFAALMEELLAPLGFDCERVVVPPDLWRDAAGLAEGERTNLLARRKTGRPVAALYFHVDTVPAAAGWQQDPFRLVETDGRLSGLGAADMKGCIAAVLLALRAAKAFDVPLAYDPMLLLCTDEEGGLYPGVRYLAEQGKLEGHVLNFNGSAEARIWAGCFGMFNVMITVKGVAAHAGEGTAAAGFDAIEGALPLLRLLQALKAMVATRTSRLPPHPGAKGPLAARLTIASLHGGTAGGQIPGALSILVNRRYPPEERFEDALAEIEALVAAARNAHPALAFETALVGHLVPTADPAGPHWPRWQRALAKGFDYPLDAFRRWGAASCSDFGYVQRATGRSEVLLGGLARPESRIHGPGEHTTRRDLISLATAVLSYLSADFAPELVPHPGLPAEGAPHAAA